MIASTGSQLTFGLVGGIQQPAQRALEYASRMESRGYRSLWYPDTLQGWIPNSLWTPEFTGLARGYSAHSPHVSFDPIGAIAATASVTRSIALGTGVAQLLRRHPAQLAQAALIWADSEMCRRVRLIWPPD